MDGVVVQRVDRQPRDASIALGSEPLAQQCRLADSGRTRQHGQAGGLFLREDRAQRWPRHVGWGEVGSPELGGQQPWAPMAPRVLSGVLGAYLGLSPDGAQVGSPPVGLGRSPPPYGSTLPKYRGEVRVKFSLGWARFR